MIKAIQKPGSAVWKFHLSNNPYIFKTFKEIGWFGGEINGEKFVITTKEKILVGYINYGTNMI